MIRVQWLEVTPEDAGILMHRINVIEIQELSTVVHALKQIGLDEQRIVSLLNQRAVAIYGVSVTESTILYDGDRIEILDDLRFNPMESRRRRAQYKLLTKQQKEFAKFQRRGRKHAKTVL